MGWGTGEASTSMEHTTKQIHKPKKTLQESWVARRTSKQAHEGNYKWKKHITKINREAIGKQAHLEHTTKKQRQHKTQTRNHWGGRRESKPLCGAHHKKYKHIRTLQTSMGKAKEKQASPWSTPQNKQKQNKHSIMGGHRTSKQIHGAHHKTNKRTWQTLR